jgi:hypothetical protein
VWTTKGGVLMIGRGLGRALARAARHLVPPCPPSALPPAPRTFAPDKTLERRPIWAQVAPGNAASVRAFLAAGYRPVGAEALLVP